MMSYATKVLFTFLILPFSVYGEEYFKVSKSYSKDGEANNNYLCFIFDYQKMRMDVEFLYEETGDYIYARKIPLHKYKEGCTFKYIDNFGATIEGSMVRKFNSIKLEMAPIKVGNVTDGWQDGQAFFYHSWSMKNKLCKPEGGLVHIR